MSTDEAYIQAVKEIQLEGKLTDYRAGELKSLYTTRRKFFILCSILTVLIWTVLTFFIRSWVVITLETIALAILLLYFLRQVTVLEYAITRVSQKARHSDKFLDEFLAPFPELHRLSRIWRSQGQLWLYDETRLLEIAQYARLEKKLPQ